MLNRDSVAQLIGISLDCVGDLFFLKIIYRIRDIKQRSFGTLYDLLIQFELKYFQRRWGIEILEKHY